MKRRVYEHGATYERVKDIPLLPSGLPNYYRIVQFLGQGGSTKEPTWDRQAHKHTCCGSAVPWRHKVACPNLGDGTLPPDE